jgi:hypothetical protein
MLFKEIQSMFIVIIIKNPKYKNAELLTVNGGGIHSYR